MKVVILAGGLGSRLSEYTESIPKPMVTVGGIPILMHIMKHYSDFGFKDFVIACGYKSEVIKQFFAGYFSANSDFTINLSTGALTPHGKPSHDWNVTVVDTGLESLTGKRLAHLARYLEGERFMLTYGDGLSDVNITDLIAHHSDHANMVTLTAVRPTARFGELTINDGSVESFEEKPQLHSGWINGGFFVMEPEFLNLVSVNENVMLEREPLTRAVELGQLSAYQHTGFWQCMDTKRDRETLEALWVSEACPWRIETCGG